MSVPNRPGIVAQLALAIGEAGVNIVDMALYPAADMQSGAIALWVAGEGSAERVVELIGGLGYPASVVDGGAQLRFEPASRLAGALTPPPDKSISHRAALLGAMSRRADRRSATTCAPRTPTRRSAAMRALGAEVDGARGHGGRDRAGVGPARRRRRGAIDVGNAGTLLRLLPGLARGPGRGAAGRSTATRASGAGRSTASPSRCALMGARVECRDGRLPPLAIEGARARRDPLRAAGRERPGEVVRAAGGAARRRARRPWWRRCRAATTPSGCWSRPGAELDVARAAVVTRARRRAPRARRGRGARRLLLGRVLDRRPRRSCPARELRLEAVGVNPTRIGLLRVLERMGARRRGRDRGAWSAMEPVAELVVAQRAAARDDGRGRRRCRSLIDELPLVALLGAFAEGTTVVTRRRASCATRSRTGSRPSSRACAALGADDRGAPGRLRGRGRGGAARRHARRGRRPPARDAGRGGGPRVARRASRCGARRPRTSPIQASSSDLDRVTP